MKISRVVPVIGARESMATVSPERPTTVSLSPHGRHLSLTSPPGVERSAAVQLQLPSSPDQRKEIVERLIAARKNVPLSLVETFRQSEEVLIKNCLARLDILSRMGQLNPDSVKKSVDTSVARWIDDQACESDYQNYLDFMATYVGKDSKSPLLRKVCNNKERFLTREQNGSSTRSRFVYISAQKMFPGSLVQHKKIKKNYRIKQISEDCRLIFPSGKGCFRPEDYEVVPEEPVKPMLPTKRRRQT